MIHPQFRLKALTYPSEVVCTSSQYSSPVIPTSCPTEITSTTQYSLLSSREKKILREALVSHLIPRVVGIAILSPPSCDSTRLCNLDLKKIMQCAKGRRRERQHNPPTHQTDGCLSLILLL